ncbi:MAG: TIGR04283 family arsenosugar biosynthesis glycosyltransferase [Desulfofustis sp.]|nr:TIGR04283 family arsenosugar biosynthesis glycosyltransferase [Desulfofustis sp.]
MSPALAVIIPALNEEEQLPATLDALSGEPSLEIVVADGGSTDTTVALARSAGCRVVGGPPGRGRQLNIGVAASTAELLLFLHADTRLPPGFAATVEQTLARREVALGAFSLAIDSNAPSHVLLARLANLRSRWLSLPYGDQALFTTRMRFEQVGGFPEIEIMEDFVFVRRMRRVGRIVTLPERATTSARRWHNLGVVQTTLINQLIVCGYAAGVKPARLARWYRRLRGVAGPVDRP